MLSISVVMTTYNGERFIIEQLESIRNQSISIDEVLIFDDKSSDRTVQIVSDYVEKFKLINWRVIENSKQVGWKVNFIRGFNAASGDIIFPCDQDDIWHNDKIEKMSKIMVERQDIDVLASNYEPFFMDGAKIFTRDYLDDESVTLVSLSNQTIYNQRPGCSMAFRKHFFVKYKRLWNEELAHDEFLWKTALLTSSLAIFNAKTIDYRRHANNATKKIHSISNRKSENRGCKLFFEMAKKEECFINKNFVDRQYYFYKNRDEFFENKSIFRLLKLLLYLDIYKTRNNFLGDILYLIHPSYFAK